MLILLTPILTVVSKSDLRLEEKKLLIEWRIQFQKLIVLKVSVETFHWLTVTLCVCLQIV